MKKMIETIRKMMESVLTSEIFMVFGALIAGRWEPYWEAGYYTWGTINAILGFGLMGISLWIRSKEVDMTEE